MPKQTVNLIVKGLVQGVFFRAETLKKALEFEVVGWVKNLSDGNVEITAEGNKENLNNLIEWCKLGTTRTRVDSVQIEYLPYENKFTDFQIKY
ncbi:MAG: acylphosphatase [Thermodesulfobacteriota bacterium]